MERNPFSDNSVLQKLGKIENNHAWCQYISWCLVDFRRFKFGNKDQNRTKALRDLTATLKNNILYSAENNNQDELKVNSK